MMKQKVDIVKKIIEDNFRFITQRNKERCLKLNNPIYETTSAYGHFGRKASNKGEFTWKRLIK